MSWLKMLMILTCVAAVFGCGPTEQDVTPPDVTARESVKAALQNVVDSGQAGSEIGAIMEKLKELETSDPQLSQELQKDAEAFMSTSNSAAQLKQKAKDMIAKIDAAGSGG